MNKIRLAILNTWCCEGDYHERLQAIIAGMMALEPDIIALQECFHTVDGQWNTARDVAKYLRMDYLQLSNRRKKRLLGSREYDSYNGLSIISRLPVKRSWEYELPTIREDGERSCLFAEFALEEIDFVLANLHLTNIRTRNDARGKQIRALLEHCNSLDQNVVLCGGFNSPLRNLYREGVLAPMGELFDTWELADGGKPKPASLHAAYRSAGIEFEHGSIDHIMYLPQSQPGLHFSNADRVFERPDFHYDVVASDHMGLVINFDAGAERLPGQL